MKTVVSLVCSIVIFVVLSAEQPYDPSVKELSREELMALPKAERSAYMQKFIVQKTGGMIVKPGSGKGLVKIVSSVPGIPMDIIAEPLQKSKRVLNLDVKVESGAPVSPQNATERRRQEKADICVFVVEDEVLPRLLAAPEEGWSIVNAKACRIDKPENVRYKIRVRKEIMRGLALALGCANCGNVMHPVVRIQDLEEIEIEALPFTTKKFMLTNLEKFGVRPVTEVSYLKACEEGWAPPPTNAYQKAIWDRFKAEKERGPSNPIQIKP